MSKEAFDRWQEWNHAVDELRRIAKAAPMKVVLPKAPPTRLETYGRGDGGPIIVDDFLTILCREKVVDLK